MQVTVVVPTVKLDPETTITPAPVLQVMVAGSITPWKESTADGVGGDQVTAAVAKPGSTFLPRMLLDVVTTGASVSAEKDIYRDIDHLSKFCFKDYSLP